MVTLGTERLSYLHNDTLLRDGRARIWPLGDLPPGPTRVPPLLAVAPLISSVPGLGARGTDWEEVESTQGALVCEKKAELRWEFKDPTLITELRECSCCVTLGEVPDLSKSGAHHPMKGLDRIREA